MTPKFQFLYQVIVEKFKQNEDLKEESILVLADGIPEAINQAEQYISCVATNSPESFDAYDIVGVIQQDVVYLGVEDETIEEEIIPENGILSKDLPKGWNRVN